MSKTTCAILVICLLADSWALAQTPAIPLSAPAVPVKAPATLPQAEEIQHTPSAAAEDLPFAMSAPAPLSQSYRLYVGAEYVLWWLREGRVPALLTTSSPANQGIIGNGDNRVLYGDDRLQTRHDDRFNGTRLTLGYWLTRDDVLALEVEAFFLERDSTSFKALSNGDTLLAIPYTNAVTGLPASNIVTGPTTHGQVEGGFVGYSRIELFGQQGNLIGLLAEGANGRLELLGGMRFLEMRDRLDPTAAGRVLPDQSVLIGLSDHFHTHDFYFGPQAGLRGQLFHGRWSMQIRGIVSLGADDQGLSTSGQTIYQTPMARVATNTGLFVQGSNLGNSHRTVFDSVYETGLNLSYQATDRIRVFGGYTFLLWANPIRAGDQVDTTINTASTGPARPQVPWQTDTFWAQGLNAGIEFRW